MASAVPVYEDQSVSIGRVVQRAVSAIQLNPVVILSLALVIGAIPGLLMRYAMVRLGLASPDAIQTGAISRSAFLGASLLSSIITLILSAFAQGALTRATVSANDGKKATFGESFSAALRVLLPLVGLSLLWAIGVAVGMMLLIIPGLILLMMWAVAVPSLVVERQGVLVALRRSAVLTAGSRWKIFGLSLVLLLIYILLSWVAGLVGLRLYDPSNPMRLSATSIIGSVVVGTIFNMLWGTIQSSLYVELRQAKEGGSIDNLEEVFA